MATVVYVENTNLLQIRGVKDALTNQFISDADIEFTVKDAEGAEVAGQTWPTTMNPDDSTDDIGGNYHGILEHTLEIEAGLVYYAHIDADAGSDRIGHWEFAFTPKVRRGV